MIKKLVFAGVLATATTAFVAPSSAAQDIPATPLQHGAPLELPLVGAVPGTDLALGTVDETTRALLQPILALGGGPAAAAPTAAAAPAKHHVRRHAAAGWHHKWHGKNTAWRTKVSNRSAKIVARHKQA